MLRQRVLTAIVLLIVLVAVLAAPWPLSWPLFLALASGLAVWEWLRLTFIRSPAVQVGGGLIMFAFLAVQAWFWVTSSTLWPVFDVAVVITALTWLLIVPFRLSRGPREVVQDSMIAGLFAPLCLYATWGALVIWQSQGIWKMLSVLILVWIADIFAYFGGRKWGTRKLAPAISPGKTLEGAYTGLAGVALWMAVTSQIDGSYAQQVFSRFGWLGVVLVALLLGSISIMGDLFESLLKRQVKIKDSSNLLPGHGGVYDRIDAVVAVVPVAYLIVHPTFF